MNNQKVVKYVQGAVAALAILKLLNSLRKAIIDARYWSYLKKTFPEPTEYFNSKSKFYYWVGGLFGLSLIEDKFPRGGQIHLHYEAFEEASKQAGRKVDTISIRLPSMLGGGYGLLTRDPQNIKHMLKDKFHTWVKPDFFGKDGQGEGLIGKSIFAVNHGPLFPEDNEFWNMQRKTGSRIFTRNIFTGYGHEVMVDNLSKLFKRISREMDGKTSGEVVVRDLIYAFTIDSICELGFGTKFDSLSKDEMPEFSRAFDEIGPLTRGRFLRPFNKSLWFLYSTERKAKKLLNYMNEFLYALIKERRVDPKLDERADILSWFLKADATQPDAYYRDVSLGFILAGRDTTACLISFCLFLLGTHLDVQEKVHDEIVSVLAESSKEEKDSGDHDKSVTYDMMKSMPWLDGVIFESLRLFPPVVSDPKSAGVDDILPDGSFIRKGTMMFFEPAAMSRDETRYPHPHEFKPERWMTKDRVLGTYDQYEFPQFQAGPRICLGKDLAIFEAKTFVAEFVRKYKMEYPKSKMLASRAEFDRDVTQVRDGVIYTRGITTSIKGDFSLQLVERY